MTGHGRLRAAAAAKPRAASPSTDHNSRGAWAREGRSSPVRPYFAETGGWAFALLAGRSPSSRAYQTSKAGRAAVRMCSSRIVETTAWRPVTPCAHRASIWESLVAERITEVASYGYDEWSAVRSVSSKDSLASAFDKTASFPFSTPITR